jgi:hypothetical protein
MIHRPEILAVGNWSKAACACGETSFREQFGPRRAAQAIHEAMVHLEKVLGAQENDTILEYQVGPKDALNCPICHEDFGLDRDDLPELLDTTTPSVLTCPQGHEFDSYYRDLTLFLFPLQVGDYTPFSTSQ